MSNATALRSKQLIKGAFLALLDSDGSDGTSVSEICAKAGLTRTTFYNHFESKADVAAALIDDIFTEYLDEIDSHGIDDVEYLIVSYLDFWASRWDQLVLLAKNNLLPLVGARFETLLSEIHTRAYFADRDLPDEELVFHNAFLARGMTGMLDVWVNGRNDTDAKTLAQYMQRMIESLSDGLGRRQQ